MYMVKVECSKCGMAFEEKQKKKLKNTCKNMRKSIILNKIPFSFF